jgi:hypothetical protein
MPLPSAQLFIGFGMSYRMYPLSQQVTQRALSPSGERGMRLYAVLHKLWHGLRLLWSFLTDTSPLSPDLEDQLGQMPATQAQRIRRRW